MAADVRRAQPEDRAELIDFRARMYGDRSPFADAAWVSWLYDDVPTRRESPALWIFRRHGTIHGQIGAILARVRTGDAERELAWNIDLMVSPEQRLRGAGAVLPKIAQATSDVLGGTELSIAARKAFARAGWRDHGTLPRWVRPVRSAFLRARSTWGRAALLAPALGVASRALGTLNTVRAHGRKLVPMNAFDERADRVWKIAGPEWPVIVRRDRDWLAWRWDACPDRRNAHAYWLERRGDPIGWVVLRIADERGVRAGQIVDLLCAPSELHALLALSVNVLGDQGADAVYCLLRAPGSEAALVSNGFIQRDSGFPMMTFASTNVPEKHSALLGAADQWFVTSGDSDLDRRRDDTVYA